MSDIFYQATRVVMDGRLGRMFTGPRAKGASTRIRLDQDPEIVEGIVSGSRKGQSPQQIANALGISPSSVIKVRGLFRARWSGYSEEQA